jgi:co-chaperonin GroES (HSP10)
LEDFSNILPTDILNGTLTGVKCVNPDELMLFEFREDELLGSGIVLMSVSTKTYDQVGILPKFRVLAVGDNVERETGIKPGDLIVIPKLCGRLRMLDEIEVRYINHRDVFAKVVSEASDYEEYLKKFFK